jgi:putative oxidoreductase
LPRYSGTDNWSQSPQNGYIVIDSASVRLGVTRMIFPQLTRFTDVALLLLRLMVGIVFVTSGYKHLKDPETRSKDIEVSKSFTILLGASELAGGLGVISGVLVQLVAISLILLMLGAIQKKIFVWHSGFWGKSGTNGWSYDTMLIVMNLVIVTTGGGNLALTRLFG